MKTTFQLAKGLTEETIRQIWQRKKEPQWMLEFRLRAFQIFQKLPLPKWGPDLSQINFEEFSYYQEVTESRPRSWKDIPQEIKATYEQLGLPEAEQRFLAGIATQAESQILYENLRRQLEKKGVIFLSIDEGLKKHPQLFRRYFASVISPADNKLAALNSAAWSGGSFIYIPPGVKISQPIQAYFLINIPSVGQFERTLIIVDEGAELNYIEGCSAPLYHQSSLHAGVVEVIVKAGAKMRYTTIQNWSKNVYNLTTQRAKVHQNATMEWIDGNIGSRITMKYPCCLLVGEGAKGYVLSLSFASRGQHHDTGAKMFHLAANTSSRVISKSISLEGGHSSYRGLVHIAPKAANSKSSVSCDALILDPQSRSDTYPTMRIKNPKSLMRHEATVSVLDKKKLNYLMSRGLSRTEAEGLLVTSFAAPITQQIPLEYASELNKLIKLEMEASVG